MSVLLRDGITVEVGGREEVPVCIACKGSGNFGAAIVVQPLGGKVFVCETCLKYLVELVGQEKTQGQTDTEVFNTYTREIQRLRNKEVVVTAGAYGE